MLSFSYILNILRTKFTASSASVSYDGFYSDSWETKCGLRQGVILSAYLSNFYKSDVLEMIVTALAGYIFGINRRNILAYADD